MGRRKGGSEHIATPKGWPEPPFSINDATSIGGRTFLVCERTVGGWRGVASTPMIYGHLDDFTFPDDECSLTPQRGKRFYPWADKINPATGKPQVFADYMQAYKRFALAQGATPEAIRLLDIHEPLTKKEVEQMAEKKLAKKAPVKKAAPKTKAEGEAKSVIKTKGKGNPEALKKAREAQKDAGPDTRKITMLVKENPYREGTKRAEAFEAAKKAKTVQDYKDSGGPAKYINRWDSEGIIKLS